ncbi:MAG: translocation/assembly module TamB domain-containing protein [Desulfuromonadaceae bacterium]
MKRFIIYGLLVILLSTALGGELALKWLLGSPDGIKWLLGAVSRNTPVTISARTVTGDLDSAVRLEDLAAQWPGGDLAIADMRLQCRPMRIPFGYVAIRELSLRGVRFRDNSPPASSDPEIVWPHITGIPAQISGWIDLFTVVDATYQQQKQPPTKIPDISASLSWRNSQLSVNKLSLKTAQGVVSGRVTAGFGTASLDSSLTFEPLTPIAGCGKIQLRTKLHTGQLPEQVAGDVTVTALSGSNPKYTIHGDVGLAGKELNLHRLTASEKGRSGTVSVTGVLPLKGDIRVQLEAAGVDITRELGKKVALSGTLDLKWDGTEYTGNLNANSSGDGWLKSRAAGRFRGNAVSVDVSALDAAVLDGAVRGNLCFDWRSGVLVKGALRGEGLNPAIIDPAWIGVVNFDVDRFIVAFGGGRVQQGEVHGRLKESRLRGKALSGEIAATLKNNNLTINRLFLNGNGFDIAASGILSQRLDLKAHISDLSGLIPQTSGSLDLQGWGRYAAGVVSGSVAGHGSKLNAEGIQISSAAFSARSAGGPERAVIATAEVNGLTYQDIQVLKTSVNVRLTDGPKHLLTAAAQLNNVTYRGVHADTASLKADGSLQNHRLEVALTSSDAAVTGKLSGGYAAGRWQGELTGFTGHDTVGPCKLAAPTALTVSAEYLEIAPLVLTGLASERLELSGRLHLKPRTGTAQASWKKLNLARSNKWLNDTRLAGESSGQLRLGLSGDERMNLTGKASATGSMTFDRQTVTISKALLDLDAGGRGTTALFELRTNEGISATGRFISSAPATLSIPSSGELHATWEGLDPALAKRWLPKGTGLRGQLSGNISGKFLPEQRYDLTGTATLANGSGSWRDNGRELTVAVRTAELRWNWRDDSLRGTFSLALAQLGDSKGNFQLPLPARFGAGIDPGGRVKGSISGTFQEDGVVNSLFPGLLQEAKSLVKVDLQAGGTWQTPAVSGTVGMTQAGAYIPSAGIRLSDVQLDAHLDASSRGTQIQIEKFRLTSGKGSLEGTAGISFTGSTLTGYRGTLRGDRFQAVNLPEQQLIIAPDLTFSGSREIFSARGVIRVPEMLLRRFSSSADIKPSGDVVVAGRESAASRATGFPLDLQFQIQLGDKVFVRYGGLDARLAGDIKLAMKDFTKATGTGEIKVARGTYRIYGVNLDIQRGRALFSGGPVERPTLDILALRTVDDVKAGVTITGTPEEPLIKLYSEPSLPDTEILSYVVLGRSLGESGSQGGLLMEAASLFVSSDNSAGLQEQLKEWIALDTITVSSGKDQRTGYKAIEPSLRSNGHSSTTTNTTGVSQAMLELGKYLTPRLYISYGKSLFDQSQQFRARYSISRRWEVESKVSTVATGGDLMYRIELK